MKSFYALGGHITEMHLFKWTSNLQQENIA